MPFLLPQLPYSQNALEPYISQRTIEYHYDKHHAAYVNKLNKLIAGTTYESMSIEDIIMTSRDSKGDAAIFNNAAQFYNHNILWLSMKPNGGSRPNGKLLEMIIAAYGSFDTFVDEFTKLSVSQFGSGWVWLAFDKQLNRVFLSSTSNAETPLTKNTVPLLTIDVWEHAYYLDYQNLRPKYVTLFLTKLVNWDFADQALLKLL